MCWIVGERVYEYVFKAGLIRNIGVMDELVVFVADFWMLHNKLWELQKV